MMTQKVPQQWLSTYRWLVLAVLAGLLLVLLATCGRSGGQEPVTTLPRPITQALTRQAVFCFGEFSDGRMDSTLIGYYPEPLDELFQRYNYDFTIASIAEQHFVCYTSWQAAFTHQDEYGDHGSERSQRLENLHEWMPPQPNEADYEVAVLYSIFGNRWKSSFNQAFSPPTKPQSWRLTQSTQRTLN